eukprot:2917159-Amphidinium_carterae.1
MWQHQSNFYCDAIASMTSQAIEAHERNIQDVGLLLGSALHGCAKDWCLMVWQGGGVTAAAPEASQKYLTIVGMLTNTFTPRLATRESQLDTTANASHNPTQF